MFPVFRARDCLGVRFVFSPLVIETFFRGAMMWQMDSRLTRQRAQKTTSIRTSWETSGNSQGTAKIKLSRTSRNGV